MRRMFSLEQLKAIAESRVQALVEGGTLENARPIYFHGLEFRNTSALTFIYAHILNNSEVEFTLTSFISWINSISNKVIVSCNGLVELSGTKYQIICLYKEANSNEINIEYIDSDGTTSFAYNVNLATLFPDGVGDGVNKIN